MANKKKITAILIALLLVVVILVALFVWPGFLMWGSEDGGAPPENETSMNTDF